MDETQYQVLIDELKCISRHLEVITLENRERQRTEKGFWGELLTAINSAETAVGLLTLPRPDALVTRVRSWNPLNVRGQWPAFNAAWGRIPLGWA